jgi:hypothetical protein
MFETLLVLGNLILKSKVNNLIYKLNLNNDRNSTKG